MSSVVVAKGVFRGVGRIVEVESLPTDPENVSRDDLVFRQGTMHISVVNVDFEFSLNPRTCIFTVSVQQTGQVEGGTGLFAAAEGSLTGSVKGGGSCRATRTALVRKSRRRSSKSTRSPQAGR